MYSFGTDLEHLITKHVINIVLVISATTLFK